MMASADRLEERFPEAIEKIAELFNYESTAMRKMLERLNAIYRVTEQKWDENIERLKKIDTQVRYVLFGEAAPWTERGEVIYFYNNPVGPWCKRIWKTFFPSDDRPLNLEDFFLKLGKKQFLLIDTLPFARQYNKKSARYKLLYKELIRDCIPYVQSKMDDERISWAPDVKIALAFRVNGLAVIDVYQQGLTLKTGQKLDFTQEIIAADDSGYTNSETLRRMWSGLGI
jgi:hypothetical protein